jgi:hypothetical protein
VINIDVNAAALEDALYILAREARLEPGRVIKEEARLVTQNIIQLTPPKTLAQGRAKVRGDLARSIGILDQNSFARAQENVRLPMRELIRRKDNETLQDAIRSMNGANWIVKPFDKKDHTSRRNRYGRVTKMSYILTTDAGKARKYFREVMSRVGWAKGAWASALTVAGGRAPNWYGKHAAASGTAFGNFGESPQFSATGFNIKIPNYQRTVSNAVRNRQRVTQTKIDRLIAGKATNLGFVTILDRR